MDGIFDKIGGRKFVMAVVLIVAGAIVDVTAEGGLSVNLLGLMTAIYATFSASNAIITNKQLTTESERAEPSEPVKPNDDVKKLASELLPVVTNIGAALDDLFKQQAAQSDAISMQTQAVSKLIELAKK